VGIGAVLGSGFWGLALALFVAGLGTAPAVAAISSVIAGSVPFADTAEAYGWITTGQLIGAAAGFVLALLVMLIISLIPISIDSVLSMLTTNGHFLWILSPTVICLKFLLTAFLAILAALGPAIRAANMIPAEALRSSK